MSVPRKQPAAPPTATLRAASAVFVAKQSLVEMPVVEQHIYLGTCVYKEIKRYL